MNDILQNIMTFINENTILLICICVFLILVLIGYLIDNSVKSKRVRNDIKNADQVPQNIKDEIIKEAKKEDTVVENTELETQPTLQNDNVELNLNETSDMNSPTDNLNQDLSLNLDTSSIDQNTPLDLNSSLDNQDTTLNLDSSSEVVTENTPLDLNSTLTNIDTPITESVDNTLNLVSKDDNQLNLENIDSPLNSDLSIQDTSIDMPLELNLDSVNNTINQEENDPDKEIMQNAIVENNEYSNDKRLSEILSQMNNFSIEEPKSNIFEEENNIVVNSEISKDDVEIETPKEADDELDKIMRKLSSIGNNVQDDNYTNIF